jgi:hypothetical protein
MSEIEQIFYFFAETPRAGQWNHRFIIPKNYDVPEDVLNKYGELVREGQKGSDFIGVRQEVKQHFGAKTGYETLILATPNYDLSKCKSQVESRLRNLQQPLEHIVTKKIDWDKDGKSLIVPNSELTQWRHDLELLLKKLKKSSPSIGGIMRHKFLFIVMVFVFIAVSTMVIAQRKITDWGNKKINLTDGINSVTNNIGNLLPGSLPPTRLSPKAESLQKWLRKLHEGEYVKETNENVLEKDLRDKLAVVVDADDSDLPTILDKINGCFNPDFTKTKNSDLKSNLKLLTDETLLENIARLYKNGQFNPAAFCINQNDEVELTLLTFSKARNTEMKMFQKHLTATIRHVISSAIEIKKSAENINDDNNWVRFSKSLSFMEDGNDICERWNIVAKYKPQWITKEDIELSRKIYQWLINDDAKALLKESLPSNYNEALQRFAKTKIDFDVNNYQELKNAGKNTEEIKKELHDDPKRKQLLESLKQFQKHVKELPFSD